MSRSLSFDQAIAATAKQKHDAGSARSSRVATEKLRDVILGDYTDLKPVLGIVSARHSHKKGPRLAPLPRQKDVARVSGPAIGLSLSPGRFRALLGKPGRGFRGKRLVLILVAAGRFFGFTAFDSKQT